MYSYFFVGDEFYKDKALASETITKLRHKIESLKGIHDMPQDEFEKLQKVRELLIQSLKYYYSL